MANHGKMLSRSCELKPVGYLAGVDWQQKTSLGVVALTAALFIWNWVRAPKENLNSCAACGYKPSGVKKTACSEFHCVLREKNDPLPLR